MLGGVLREVSRSPVAFHPRDRLGRGTSPGMRLGAEPSSHEHESYSGYLDRLMRRSSFEALWPLFAKAPKPAKELTESFSALVHLRPFMREHESCRVVHVGDGAHARTAALFCLKTKASNVSVDPILNLALVDGWRERFAIKRLERHRARIEDVSAQLNALPPAFTLVTFVHAHVAVAEVLARLRWNVAFTLACCVPGKQLVGTSPEYVVHTEGEDANVLSSSRRYQVLLNTNAGTQ
jgi:hypothetical protein